MVTCASNKLMNMLPFESWVRVAAPVWSTSSLGCLLTSSLRQG